MEIVETYVHFIYLTKTNYDYLECSNIYVEIGGEKNNTGSDNSSDISSSSCSNSGDISSSSSSNSADNSFSNNSGDISSFSNSADNSS